MSRLGELQRLVLLVVRRFSSRTFTISDVRVTLKEELNIDVDRRRLWDVFQRLVRRGIIEKVGRGLYRLVKDIDESLLKLRELNDNLCRGGCGGVVRVGCCGLCCGGCGVGVVRVHGVVGDVVTFVRRVLFWYYYLGLRVGGVVDFLCRYYGVPKYLLRRLVRVARGLARAVAGFDAVVGGHGFYGRRVRGFRRFSSLVPLAYLDGGHVYELGFDTEIPEGLVKELLEFLGGSGFLKLYVKPLRGS
jgi:hypothetical protein